MTLKSSHPTFHGEDVVPSEPGKALFHIIPVPLEQSVSYGTGTSLGPRAILEASSQLELLTRGVIPAEHGIYTAPEIDCSGQIDQILQRIETQVKKSTEQGGLPVILGGEHTVTCGVIPALKKVYPEFGVIQFDAHADLRDSYEGNSFSHACVMRRIHEQGVPIAQLGIRSYSAEELGYLQDNSIYFVESEDVWRDGLNLDLPGNFPKKVYITFDVDAFDSGFLPATGTPVPGGLNWYQALWLIEQIMAHHECVGFDVVELSPIENLHAPTFTTAQLVYDIMALFIKKTHKNLISKRR